MAKVSLTYKPDGETIFGLTRTTVFDDYIVFEKPTGMSDFEDGVGFYRWWLEDSCLPILTFDYATDGVIEELADGKTFKCNADLIITVSATRSIGAITDCPLAYTKIVNYDLVLDDVTYDGPLTTIVESSTDYGEEDITIAIPDQIPSKPGYTFVCWSDSPFCDQEYAPGSSTTLRVYREVTIFAIWRKDAEPGYMLDNHGNTTQYVLPRGFYQFYGGSLSYNNEMFECSGFHPYKDHLNSKEYNSPAIYRERCLPVSFKSTSPLKESNDINNNTGAYDVSIQKFYGLSILQNNPTTGAESISVYLFGEGVYTDYSTPESLPECYNKICNSAGFIFPEYDLSGAEFSVNIEEAQVVAPAVYEFFKLNTMYLPYYTLSGCWRISSTNGELATSEVIQEVSNFYEPVPFTTDNGMLSCSGFIFGDYHSNSNQIDYELPGGSQIPAYLEYTWLRDEYRIIDFGPYPVQVSSTFYYWFMDYAYAERYPHTPTFDINNMGLEMLEQGRLGRLAIMPIPEAVAYRIYQNNHFVTEIPNVYSEEEPIEVDLSTLPLKTYGTAASFNIIVEAVIGNLDVDLNDHYASEHRQERCLEVVCNVVLLPPEISLRDDVLIINADPGSTTFRVYFNDGTGRVQKEILRNVFYLDLTDCDWPDGDIDVVAYTRGSSPTSDIITYKSNLIFVKLNVAAGNITLATKNKFCERNIRVELEGADDIEIPKATAVSASIDTHTLTITKSGHSDAIYEIIVNGLRAAITDKTTFDLYSLNLEPASHIITIKVRASGLKDSDLSPSIIYSPFTFTIDGEYYYAENGMKWSDWIASRYNPFGADAFDNSWGVKVTINGQTKYVCISTGYTTPALIADTDTILNKHEYVLQ